MMGPLGPSYHEAKGLMIHCTADTLQQCSAAAPRSASRHDVRDRERSERLRYVVWWCDVW